MIVKYTRNRNDSFPRFSSSAPPTLLPPPQRGGRPHRKGHSIAGITPLGRRLFSEGGGDDAKNAMPPKMALGQGMLFALLGEGKEGGANQIFAEENRDFSQNMRKKSKVYLTK